MCSRSCLLPYVEYERLLTAVQSVFPYYFRRHQCLSTECIRIQKTRLDILDETHPQKKRQETYGQIKAYKSHFSYRLFGWRICVCASCLILLCLVLSWLALCCVGLCCVVLCCLCCAVLCYCCLAVLLCCLVLSCLLTCVVLSYVALCYVVLCCLVSSQSCPFCG